MVARKPKRNTKPMQNPGVVRGAQAIGYAHQQFQDFAAGATVFALRVFGPVFERAAIDVFRDQVLPAFDLSGIVDRDNMRMIQ